MAKNGKKNVSSPQKWQIVGLLKSGDKKQNEIAKLLGVSPKCVSSTKKRYEETGSVSDRSRSGRPRKLTFRDENYIFREIRKDPTSSYQKLATDFNSKTQGVRISKYTIMRYLKKKGLESHTAVRKPLLNIKDRQKIEEATFIVKVIFNKLLKVYDQRFELLFFLQ